MARSIRTVAQADMFGPDPAVLIRANRAAADAALYDPAFTLSEREARHAHYLAEAERYEKLDAARA